MPYVIRKANDDILLYLEDGQINTSETSLTLVGRGFSGYGEYVANNFVKLVENFADTTAPENPLAGQIWYDTTEEKLKYWTETSWKTVTDSDSTVKRKETAPTTSKGQSGDTEGCIAVDGTYFYYCVGTYNGVTDIWKRVAWTGGTW